MKKEMSQTDMTTGKDSTIEALSFIEKLLDGVEVGWTGLCAEVGGAEVERDG